MNSKQDMTVLKFLGLLAILFVVMAAVVIISLFV